MSHVMPTRRAGSLLPGSVWVGLLALSLVWGFFPLAALAEEEGRVTGTVTSSEGGSAADVCVAVFVDGSPALVTFSAGDGSYVLEPLPTGTFDVQAYDCLNEPEVWSDSEVRMVSVTDGQTTSGVDFVVAPTGADPSDDPPGSDALPDDPEPEPEPEPDADDEPVSFDDTAGHVFADDIAWLANSEITRGCNPPDNTRFCPDDPVTRGEMAAFLNRALGLPAGSGVFGDTSGHVFEADIAALAEAEITRGCDPPDNTRFCPDDLVTRGQMAAFLHRALPPTLGPASFDMGPPPPPELDLANVVIQPPVTNPLYLHRFLSTANCDYSPVYRYMLTLSSMPEFVDVPNVRSGWNNDFGWEWVRHALFRWDGGRWALEVASSPYAHRAADVGVVARSWLRWTGSRWVGSGSGAVGLDWSKSTQTPGYYAVATYYQWSVNGSGWRDFTARWVNASGTAGTSSSYYCYKPA